MKRFTHGAIKAAPVTRVLQGKTVDVDGVSKGHISYNGETILRAEHTDYDLLVERLKYVQDALNYYDEVNDGVWK